ncbi:helix-turn-helix domain-containing protein, partial [Lactiplantibacillus pingfangensis]|uniref:helix-turn-helix domain-containing protein n=1 Tax=Lactiplantibacillus pingfangensis TaxID=2559915 RepID=UPI0010F9A1B3
MGRKGARYSLEDKLAYINLVEQGMSARQIQHQYGVKDDQIRQWVQRYQAEGLAGLKRRKVHRYSPEFKQKVVELYLAGNTSYPQLASQFDIPNSSVIYQWVNLYTSGKPFTTTRRSRPMKTGRKTTQIERIEIAQWVIANDLNYNGATKKFSVSYGQVYAWVKKFKQDGPEALQDRRGKDKSSKPNLTDEEKQALRIKELEARNAYLSKENEVLKKLKELERKDAQQSQNIVP